MLRRPFAFTLATSLLLSAAMLGTAAAQRPAKGASTTFNRDVAPIVQKACVACHRSGGMAPMSLETYREARPWAKWSRTRL